MKRMRILLVSVLMTMVVLISTPVVYADVALVSVNGGGDGTQIHVTAGVDFTLQIGIVEGSYDTGSFTFNIETSAPMVYGNIGNPVSGSGTSGTSGAIMISTPGEYRGDIYLHYNGANAGTMKVTFVVSAPADTGGGTTDTPVVSAPADTGGGTSEAPPDTPLYTVTFDAGEGAFTPAFITNLGPGWTGTNRGSMIRTATSPGYSAGRTIQLMPSGENGNVAPYYDDHKLVGWTGSAGTLYIIGGYFTVPSYNITLTAVWEEDVKPFKLTIHANHSEANPDLVEFGPYEETTPVSLEDIDFKREGYTLLGYAEASDAKEATYNVDASFDLSSDMTLYAVWEQDEDDDKGGIGAVVNPGNTTNGGVTGNPNGTKPIGVPDGGSPITFILIGIVAVVGVITAINANKSKSNGTLKEGGTFGSIVNNSINMNGNNITAILSNELSFISNQSRGGIGIHHEGTRKSATSLADGIVAGHAVFADGDNKNSYYLKEEDKTANGVPIATHPGSVGTVSGNGAATSSAFASGMSLSGKSNFINTSAVNGGISFGGTPVSGISTATLAEGSTLSNTSTNTIDNNSSNATFVNGNK